MKKLLCLLLSLVGLSGCSQSLDAYADKGPKLDLQHYLNGKISGTGIIKNWRGQVVQQFDFTGEAHWQGDQGHFNESMKYYDGKADHRQWTLTRIRDDYYIGKTPDVPGQANIHIRGNTMQWQYQMTVDNKGKKVTLSFDDWMYLMRGNVLINHNIFKKFGFTVGSLILVMHKENE